LGYAAAAVEVTPISRMFKALGDDVRLRIVALLAHGELCVCHIEEALALTQPNASRHLGILRAAGLVSHQRRDKWVYYRLARQANADCARHLKALVSSFAKKDVLRKDVERLVKAKGPGACK
jgi:ArsR family transcriptional regulator